MNKKGRKVRNWKKRFFVLKGNKLSYYGKENDKTPLGDINLETCMIDELKEREESGRVCIFKFSTPQHTISPKLIAFVIFFYF